MNCYQLTDQRNDRATFTVACTQLKCKLSSLEVINKWRWLWNQRILNFLSFKQNCFCLINKFNTNKDASNKCENEWIFLNFLEFSGIYFLRNAWRTNGWTNGRTDPLIESFFASVNPTYEVLSGAMKKTSHVSLSANGHYLKYPLISVKSLAFSLIDCCLSFSLCLYNRLLVWLFKSPFIRSPVSSYKFVLLPLSISSSNKFVSTTASISTLCRGIASS